MLDALRRRLNEMRWFYDPNFKEIGGRDISDAIEKRIELKAPISRVWRALTDYHEFEEWFHVKLDGPFEAGHVSHGHMTYPGYERLEWEVGVEKIDPQHLFSFTWHPYALAANRDYSKELPTLIKFRLEETENGTRLLVTESGFEKIPSDRRTEAFQMDEAGWDEQLKNIKRYIEHTS